MKQYTNQYINGEWVKGTGSKEMVNTNPYTGEELYRYQSASIKDVDAAYEAAYEAQKSWAKISPAERVSYLEKLVIAVESSKDEIYDTLTKEGGFIQPKVDFEFHTSVNIIKEAMRYPYMMDGKILPSNIPGKENYIVRESKGVIAVIAPWNVPLVLAMRSVIPAIATGNTVVLKPATDTPASAFLIADFFEKAGIPKGVLNVVAGSGAEIGDAIVTHKHASLISFTGSTDVGKRIGSMAGNMIKDVSLELGGNNAMVVLEDANIDDATSAAVFGAFFNQGQVCMALNRIIIMDSIYDEFAKVFVEKAKHLPTGDPADRNTFMGPIINASQIRSVEGFIEAMKGTKAIVALEGKKEGNVITPWIYTEATNDMPAAANEVFGPLCSLIRAKNEEEAIALANDCQYGLSGSVFCTDLYHGMQVAKQFKSGMVHVNDQSINDEPHVMFGGNKESGVGRFNGKWVMEKFTVEKWVSVQTTKRF